MSKKFGKFLLFSAVAGASAYGAYHYLKTKENPSADKNAEDMDDDFDDFSEDLDEEPEPVKERSYVSLNLDKAEAIATEAFHKAKEVIVDSVNQVKETVKSVTESQANSDSNFTDLTALNKEKEEETETDSGETNATTEEFFDDEDDTAKKAESETAENTAPVAEETAPANDTSADEAPADDTDKLTSENKVEEFFDD